MVKNNKLYWAPRILTICFILFLSLFSLDIFGNGYTFWETIVGLFMHNIPVLILLGIYLWNWRKGKIIGSALIVSGFIYIGFLVYNTIVYKFEWYMLMWALTIAGPAFVTGWLYFIGEREDKK